MKELAIGEVGEIEEKLVKCVEYYGDYTPCAFVKGKCPPSLCSQYHRKDGVSVLFLLAELCTWTQDTDGIWHTSCGSAHEFTTGTPEENEHRYCPYCGKLLEAKGEKQ